MFGPVNPTPYDLYFPLFGIQIRVHPAFWLMTIIFGWSAMRVPVIGKYLLLAWMVCVFISILVHEMGHALTMKAFGYRPAVALYWMGGVAMYQPDYRDTRTKRMLITAAGPAAGFVLYGLLKSVMHFSGLEEHWLRAGVAGNTKAEVIWYFIQDMYYVNLWWGLINLLPVLPLDGGHLSEEICRWISPRNGQRVALMIAIAAGAAVAFYALKADRTYLALLFGMLAFQNFQAYQQIQGGRGGW